eukprot:TRINITY_DN5498_c0_g1_i1.p1 TRINITY_DN5498_c0_g1~~TRINITY_DN5498_c0_g1_i1.p1  ORF type:complete len:1216 (-),score=268.76 TRINITY_DN5498_c0_g1_i1:8-3655(-)
MASGDAAQGKLNRPFGQYRRLAVTTSGSLLLRTSVLLASLSPGFRRPSSPGFAHAQAASVPSANVDEAAAVHDWLPGLLAAAKTRSASAGIESLCSLKAADGRQNFFLLWPLPAEQFGQLAYAVVESVLFHHPDANVVVLSTELESDLLDAYLREGYCAVSAPLKAEEMAHVIGGALGIEAAKMTGHIDAMKGDTMRLHLYNVLAISLQILHGGVSMPMDGLLLNPFDFMLPRQLSLGSAVVLLERLLPTDGSPSEMALEGDDFDMSWLPRAYSDRADAFTVLCLETICPRAIPAGSTFGQALLTSWLQAVEEAMEKGSKEPVEVSQTGTTLYRMYVRQRPKPAPFEVDGFTFSHEMVALAYWAIMEPHFQDGWKAYGGGRDLNGEHTQVFSPRAQREATDWTLISSYKLWLPTHYGPQSARNILPRSVVDLALRYFTLGIMPRPYRQKTFGKPKNVLGRRLRSPRDSITEFGIEGQMTDAKHEAALPGVTGGFRTFKQLRLVGRDAPPSAAAAQAAAAPAAGAPSAESPWRLTISSKGSWSPLFFCRTSHRPVEASKGVGGAAHRACQQALEAARRGGPAASTDSWRPVWDICGTAGEVNAAVTLLAYQAAAKGVASPPDDKPGLDMRLTSEELATHFGDLKVTASGGCAQEVASVPTISLELSALLDDVEEHMTVLAHCAERCHLLDRMALSFREMYAKIDIITTCECSEEEAGCSEPVAHSHPNISGMITVTVPYDFGLSRGKSLLVSMAKTEFVLVLDDDFVYNFHSCLECMLWRMRSRYHSQWRPFDILGFPILEDERMFGAFRGQLRVTSHQLFLDPVAEMMTPDGCLRVDICPMVFLARTSRMSKFKFQKELAVGEHEQYFYSNAYFGLQVAVCFDSSFPHFRVNTMSAGYVKRRERMPKLMQSAFSKLGFQRTMYLFRKYATDNMTDYDELLDKSTPPWYIGDDTCGPRPSPPVPFSQMMVLVISTGDEAGQRFRQALRSGSAWLSRFSEWGSENFRRVFAVAADGAEEKLVLKEQDEHRDVLLMPADTRAASTADDASTEGLLRALAMLRDYQFRWLVIVKHNVFVQVDRLVQSIMAHDTPVGKVLANWQTSGAPGVRVQTVDPRLMVMSRDIFGLLSGSRLGSRLAFRGLSSTGHDLSGLKGGLNAWLQGLAVERVPLPGLHFGSGSSESDVEVAASAAAGSCPANLLALSPVTPEQLQVLSCRS